MQEESERVRDHTGPRRKEEEKKAGQSGFEWGKPQSHLSEQGWTCAKVGLGWGCLAWVEVPRGLKSGLGNHLGKRSSSLLLFGGYWDSARGSIGHQLHQQ